MKRASKEPGLLFFKPWKSSENAKLSPGKKKSLLLWMNTRMRYFTSTFLRLRIRSSRWFVVASSSALATPLPQLCNQTSCENDLFVRKPDRPTPCSASCNAGADRMFKWAALDVDGKGGFRKWSKAANWSRRLDFGGSRVITPGSMCTGVVTAGVLNLFALCVSSDSLKAFKDMALLLSSHTITALAACGNPNSFMSSRNSRL
jgi:hypothetical protein